MGDKNLEHQLDGLFSSMGDAFAEPDVAETAAHPSEPQIADMPLGGQSTSDTGQFLPIEMETVAAISDLTATVFDPDELLQQVAELIKTNFNLYHVDIYFLNKDSGQIHLTLAASAGQTAPQNQPERTAVPVQNNHALIARVARNKVGALNNDLLQDTNFVPESNLPESRAELAVPMKIVDQVIGVLDVRASRANYFSAQDIPVYATLAAQIVVAAQNIRLLRNSEDQARRLTLLNEMGASLNVTATLNQAFEVAAGYISRIVPSERTSVVVLNGNKDGVRVYAFRSESGARPMEEHRSLEGTAVGEAIQQKAMVNIPYLLKSEYADCQQLAEQGFFSTLIVPLIAGKQAIGALIVSSKTVNAYTIRDEELLRHIASFLTSTIKNRRLFNQIQTSLTEAEILYETSADINTAQTYDEVLDALYRYTLLGDGAIDVRLNYFDQPQTETNQPKWVLLLSRISETRPEMVQTRYPYELFASAIALFRPDEPLVIANIADETHLSRELRSFYIEQLGAKSTLLVPLGVGGQWVGFLNASYAHLVTFLDEEMRRLLSLAGQAAVATQNLYTLSLSKQQTRELIAVNKVLHEVSRQLEMEEVLETVYQEIRRIVSVEAFYVALYNRQSGMLTFPLVYDQGQPRPLKAVPAAEHPDIDRVIKTGQTAFITRTPEQVAVLHQARQKITADKGDPAATLLFIPLLLGEQILGVMSVQSYQYDAYSERDVLLMSSMANHVAVAIQNAKLYKEARARARREAILREITTQVRGSVDVDTVMRISAQQVGRALGRRAFVYLQRENAPVAGRGTKDTSNDH